MTIENECLAIQLVYLLGRPAGGRDRPSRIRVATSTEGEQLTPEKMELALAAISVCIYNQAGRDTSNVDALSRVN